MNKILYLAALIVLACAGCSKDENKSAPTSRWTIGSRTFDADKTSRNTDSGHVPALTAYNTTTSSSISVVFDSYPTQTNTYFFADTLSVPNDTSSRVSLPKITLIAADPLNVYRSDRRSRGRASASIRSVTQGNTTVSKIDVSVEQAVWLYNYKNDSIQFKGKLMED